MKTPLHQRFHRLASEMAIESRHKRDAYPENSDVHQFHDGKSHAFHDLSVAVRDGDIEALDALDPDRAVASMLEEHAEGARQRRDANADKRREREFHSGRQAGYIAFLEAWRDAQP